MRQTATSGSITPHGTIAIGYINAAISTVHSMATRKPAPPVMKDNRGLSTASILSRTGRTRFIPSSSGFRLKEMFLNLAGSHGDLRPSSACTAMTAMMVPVTTETPGTAPMTGARATSAGTSNRGPNARPGAASIVSLTVTVLPLVPSIVRSATPWSVCAFSCATLTSSVRCGRGSRNI